MCVWCVWCGVWCVRVVCACGVCVCGVCVCMWCVCMHVCTYACTFSSTVFFILSSFSASPDNSKIYILYRFCLLLFLREISVVQGAGYINSSRLWKILIVKHLSLSEFFFLFCIFFCKKENNFLS